MSGCGGNAKPRGGDVCLFLHIPKTAGTTLNHRIYHNYSVRGDGGNWFHDGLYYFPYGFDKAKRPGLTPSSTACSRATTFVP